MAIYKKTQAVSTILLAIILSHFFFTYYIHISNRQLYENIAGMINAGYIAVPNAHILPSLLLFGPCFIGAAFFTLTIGITLPVLSYFLARLWVGPFKRSNQYLAGMMGCLFLCLYWVNQNGINFLFSVWLTGVFLLVFMLTARQNGSDFEYFSSSAFRLHLPLLILLSILWTLPANGNVFISIRDRILFPSDVGKKIIDLYYRYTLYPAESIKSFDQKLFTTCRLENFQNKDRYQTIMDKLPAYNYLPITNENRPVDLIIFEKENMLFFTVRGRVVLKKNPNVFLSNIPKIFAELSRETDRHWFIRRLVAVSLLLGLPLVAYGLLFCTTRLVLNGFLSVNKLSFSTSAACLGLVTVCYLFIILTAPKAITIKQLPEVLSSRNWKVRSKGLQMVLDQQLEIMSYTDPSEILKSPYPLERMWLARSFGDSRSPKTFELLWTLIDDEHPNVACMALRSIGKRGDTSAVLPVIHWIKNSTHWYAQWYAYQTLKMLKWKQQTLN